MAEIYANPDKLIRDYGKLSPENKGKAARYIKNLLRLQRAEQGIEIDLHLLHVPAAVENGDEIRCSFCKNPQEKAFRLIAADDYDRGVYICDECARLCNEILDEETGKMEGADATH